MVNKQDLLAKIKSNNNIVFARLEELIDQRLNDEFRGSNLVQIPIDGADEVVVEAIRAKYTKEGWTVSKGVINKYSQRDGDWTEPSLDFS